MDLLETKLSTKILLNPNAMQTKLHTWINQQKKISVNELSQ